MLVSIRVIELSTEEPSTLLNPLQVFIHSSDYKDDIQKIQITSNSTGNVLYGKNPIEIQVDNHRQSTIFFALKRRRLIIQDDLIGHVALPAIWFRKNYIVREWFPIKMQSSPEIVHNILLDIHFRSNHAEPFAAPYTMLRTPIKWPRPFLNDHAEISLAPPVVFIQPHVGPIQPGYAYPENSQSPTSIQFEYIPKHQMFYDQNMNSIGYFISQRRRMQNAPHQADSKIDSEVMHKIRQEQMQNQPAPIYTPPMMPAVDQQAMPPHTQQLQNYDGPLQQGQQGMNLPNQPTPIYAPPMMPQDNQQAMPPLNQQTPFYSPPPMSVIDEQAIPPLNQPLPNYDVAMIQQSNQQAIPPLDQSTPIYNPPMISPVNYPVLAEIPNTVNEATSEKRAN